jgi:hypothetical protein
MAEGPSSAKSAASKDWFRGYQRAMERLKWLSQIVEERARQLEICGFESFREAVVN